MCAIKCKTSVNNATIANAYYGPLIWHFTIGMKCDKSFSNPVLGCINFLLFSRRLSSRKSVHWLS